MYYMGYPLTITDETLQTTLPWPIAVVKWYRIHADWSRPRRPGGVVNKTQAKARRTRDTFAMRLAVSNVVLRIVGQSVARAPLGH